jgi:hypothetical protein
MHVQSALVNPKFVNLKISCFGIQTRNENSSLCPLLRTLLVLASCQELQLVAKVPPINGYRVVQQVLAAGVLWLQTKWIYEREAQHLQEVGQDILEESSSADLLGGPQVPDDDIMSISACSAE